MSSWSTAFRAARRVKSLSPGPDAAILQLLELGEPRTHFIAESMRGKNRARPGNIRGFSQLTFQNPPSCLFPAQPLDRCFSTKGTRPNAFGEPRILDEVGNAATHPHAPHRKRIEACVSSCLANEKLSGTWPIRFRCSTTWGSS